jgi:hypothetical protein
MRNVSIGRATVVAGFLFLGAPCVAHACPSTGLSGNYSATFTGTSFGKKLSAAGFVDASAGVFSGSLTYSLGGSIRTVSLSGNYTANSCGGSATINFSNGNIVHFNFYVSSGGRKFVGVETDGGTTVAIEGAL